MASKGLDGLRNIIPFQVSDLKTPQQKAFAGITALGILIAVVAVAVSSFSTGSKVRSLADCDGEVTADCIEIAPGEFSAQGGDDVTRYFARDGESRKRIQLSVSPTASRELRSQADGLYVDGDLVGLEDRNGQRYWVTQRRLLSGPWLIVFGAGLVIAIGGGMATTKLVRED